MTSERDEPQFIPRDEVLPCGCVVRFAIVNDERTMTWSPCRFGCPYLAAALGMADEAGKNVEFRRGT